MSEHPPRSSRRFSLAATIWLTVVWVLLWGDLSWANVLAGLAIALVVGTALRMPPVEFSGRIHPVPLAFLAGRFLVEIVVASFEVALLAFSPGRVPRSAVIGVQLRSHSDLYLTLTAEVTSLVPGTIVVEAHRVTGMLYVHVLDVDLAGGLEAAHEHVLKTEARILRAIASDDELRAAGLTRHRRARSDREVTR